MSEEKIDWDDPEFVPLTPREIKAIAHLINEAQKCPPPGFAIHPRLMETLVETKVKLAEQLKELREK